MTRTGKTEQIANYYLIAANGFIKEHLNEDKLEQGVVDESDDDDDDDINGRSYSTKGGVSKGILKLVHNEQHLLQLEKEYADIKDQKTAQEFKQEHMFVSVKLKNADLMKREKISYIKREC